MTFPKVASQTGAVLCNRRTFADLSAPTQAGILCNDPRFQEFAAMRLGFPKGRASPTATAEYVRRSCDIASRRDLATSPKAAARFQALRTDFDAWVGKIATPKPEDH